MSNKLILFRLVFLVFILLTSISHGQDKNIEGIVSDNSGVPLPGVTVILKGTNFGTSSLRQPAHHLPVSPHFPLQQLSNCSHHCCHLHSGIHQRNQPDSHQDQLLAFEIGPSAPRSPRIRFQSLQAQLAFAQCRHIRHIRVKSHRCA